MNIEQFLKSVFDGRLIIITGTGRSGTTIFGKVLGSMTPAYYLFEPALMKFADEMHPEIFYRLLFEDYFRPLVHGRGNLNVNDDSCLFNYYDQKELAGRQMSLRRRTEGIDYIMQTKPYFVVKMPEWQPYLVYSFDNLYNIWYVELVRNGLEVVDSSLRRGWYTDEYCDLHMVEKTRPGKVSVPHFIKDNDLWQRANPATRAAMVWRTLTELGTVFEKQLQKSNKVVYLRIYYEDFCRDAARWIKTLSDLFDLTPTDLTQRHAKSIRQHRPHPATITYNDIIEPERTYFKALNEKMGYAD